MRRVIIKLKDRINKKENGIIGDLLPSLITLFAVFFIIMMYINISENVERKNRIDMLARQYIIRMETFGKLTSSDKDRLKLELEGLGCSNIDFTGTSLTEVGYGNQVTLMIHGKMPVKSVWWLQGLNSERKLSMEPFVVYKASTGKY